MSAKESQIIEQVLSACPDSQAIYLFGSFDTGDERPDSDVDLALLLPPAQAKRAGSLPMSPLRFALEKSLGRTVDLINLRRVSTVLQKEVVFSERRIYCADQYEVETFEMLVLSCYQRLNYERREILEAFARDGRAYPV